MTSNNERELAKAHLNSLYSIDGATNVPEEYSEIANFGEFAAKLNSLIDEQKNNWFETWKTTCKIANECFMENHPSLVEEIITLHNSWFELYIQTRRYYQDHWVIES